MPNFTIIDNTSEITLNNKWVSASKFKSKNRVVDYKGCQYRIVEKRERNYSLLERLGRGLLGTVAVIHLGQFSKSVQNLFTKSKENIRFAVLVQKEILSSQKDPSVDDPTLPPLEDPEDPSVEGLLPLVTSTPLSEESSKEQTQEISFTDSTKLEDIEYAISKKELQQGISISEHIISKIQACMESIVDCIQKDGIKFYKCTDNNRIFTLDSVPGLIFKMRAYCKKERPMKERYQAMIHAQTVVRNHQLKLLVIPNALLFTLNANDDEYEIIAERKVDINSEESAQEQYFEDYAESLNEAIRQLATFICITGYNDVEWRNNPILNNSFDEYGNRKIALIDLEIMNNAKLGLFGGSRQRGLVRCVTEAQGTIVLAVANDFGIQTESFTKAYNTFAKAYDTRKQEIEEGRKLKAFYKAKNITVGNEPIQIDENSIDFSEHPDKVKRLRQLTKDLVQALNDKILKSSSEESIKGRRKVYINMREEPFAINSSYLSFILPKLMDLGVLHSFNKIPGHGYYLQA